MTAVLKVYRVRRFTVESIRGELADPFAGARGHRPGDKTIRTAVVTTTACGARAMVTLGLSAGWRPDRSLGVLVAMLTSRTLYDSERRRKTAA